MEEKKVGFRTEEIANDIVLGLCNCVWYLSPFFDQLLQRSCHLPSVLAKFANVRDWKGQKVAKPRVSFY
jgi:hypothetical protein